MNVIKSFPVFGEQIDVWVSTKETGGSFCQFVQNCPPGGGPPPHIHGMEDEIFRALEGEFELFDGETWNKLPTGEYRWAKRGSLHTFRNCGTTMGRIMCIAMPGGLDEYLEKISVLVMPQDAERLLEISVPYAIEYAQPAKA